MAGGDLTPLRDPSRLTAELPGGKCGNGGPGFVCAHLGSERDTRNRRGVLAWSFTAAPREPKEITAAPVPPRSRPSENELAGFSGG